MFAFPTYPKPSGYTAPLWRSISEPSAHQREIARTQSKLLPILIERFYNSSPFHRHLDFTGHLFQLMLWVRVLVNTSEEESAVESQLLSQIFDFDLESVQFYVSAHYRYQDALHLATALCHDLDQVALGVTKQGLSKLFDLHNSKYESLFTGSNTEKFLSK